MRAKFIGDPGDDFSGPGQITVWGVDFNYGQWTEVTDLRFGRHSHFEFEDGPKGLAAHTVKELKALAAERGVDLGDAKAKGDIIAALELAAEAEEGA